MNKKIGFVSIDVEADGPCPGIYSMLELGAVLIDNLEETFYTSVRPESDIEEEFFNDYIQENLDVTGYSREETLKFTPPNIAIPNFRSWLLEIKKKYAYTRLVMLSDNPAFDWQFVNYYLHSYINPFNSSYTKENNINPLGHSARCIGDLYAGKCRSLKANFKHLRKTPHTHNPVDDARGNAEAFIEIINSFK